MLTSLTDDSRIQVSQLMRYPSGSRPAGSKRGPQQARADMASRESRLSEPLSPGEGAFRAGDESPSERRDSPQEEVKKVYS